MKHKHDEKASFKTFRSNVCGPKDRIDRVENILVTGMPDVNVCILHCPEFWMEIKSPIAPKRANTPLFGSNHRMSQEQLNWFLAQHNAQGYGCVYIDSDVHRYLVDWPYIEAINISTAKELESIAFWHAPRPMDGNDWRRMKDRIRERFT